MGICGSKDDVKETNAPTAAVPVTEKVIEPPASPRPTDFTAEIGFVVKSRVEDDSKVFINVFHHSSVLYIATTLTDKYTTDKSGNSTLTYDVVINTAVFTICSADDESKEYVSEQIIDYMNKKLPVKISQEFKIPRMKRGYVGDDIPTMKIPDASIKERLITERPEEERAVAAMTEENVHVASAAAEKSELDSPATGKTLTHAGTLNSVVEAEKSSLTRNASSLNSHVLQAAVSDATARQEGLVAAPAPARPAPAPGNSSPSKPADAMSDVGTVGTKKGVEKAPLTFSGYALKKSGSSFVGLQTRFFHLSEHGVVSYYQTVRRTVCMSVWCAPSSVGFSCPYCVLCLFASVCMTLCRKRITNAARSPRVP